MGLESISEPDFDMPEEEDDDEFADAEDRIRSASASPDTSLPSTHSKSEVDTEEDPLDPITPGPGRMGFHDVRAPGRMQKQGSTSTTGSSQADSLDFEDEDDEDWSAPEVYNVQPEADLTTPVSEEPDLVNSQATILRGSVDMPSTVRSKAKKSKKKSNRPPLPQQQFPFPATSTGEEEAPSPEKRVPQMRTAKARDGGRTQSGGVRGVPADDIDDF